MLITWLILGLAAYLANMAKTYYGDDDHITYRTLVNSIVLGIMGPFGLYQLLFTKGFKYPTFLDEVVFKLDPNDKLSKEIFHNSNKRNW